ncbi:hypothetical protein [Sandaracinus amylolyticus]|uniref:hypothetical protein n=1 Tax=Sandaracinus amylolyticus TaxID=927083 RepID=UPI001F28E717|nr:hypothetical protein [Sandaracinus amylolyticus]UJR80560.1 Hypothetical protein I5071_26070 [Sandaracinus amylolyticus]
MTNVLIGARIARPAYLTLLLTSIHHVYGAWVYATPWRHHAVFVSLVAASVMAIALRLAARETLAGRVAWWVFVLTTAAIPVLMIGAFEGLYNHVIKNVLYFGGASASTMHTLFPPPTYELPNDCFFEATGILQVVPAAFAAARLVRAITA